MNINIICPTRNRPGNIIRLINSLLNTTCYFERIFLRIYVDSDDTLTPSLVDHIKATRKDINIIQVTGQNRIPITSMFNILAKDVPEDEIMFFCGDDITFDTVNWDLQIVDEFDKVKDKILLVYGDDGYQHEKLCTHFFLHKKWVTALGYVIPEIFPGDWADNYIMDVATRINRIKYLPELKTIHHHPITTNAPLDMVYVEKFNRDRQVNAPKIFNDSLSLRLSDANKLLKHIL